MRVPKWVMGVLGGGLGVPKGVMGISSPPIASQLLCLGFGVQLWGTDPP